MGTGARAYRAVKGESQALLEHLTAMIPVQEQQAESELKIRQAAFEQELAQAEKMGLLSQKLSAAQTQPVYVTQTTEPEQAKPNYTWLIIIGIIAIFLIKKKGKIL